MIGAAFKIYDKERRIVLSSPNLGEIFTAGDKAPQTGNYELLNDGHPHHETIVIEFKKGEIMPIHPEVGDNTQWRLIRIGGDTSAYREDL